MEETLSSKEVVPEGLQSVPASQAESKVNQTQTVAICPTSTCDRCKIAVRPLADTLPDMKSHIIAVILFVIGLPFCVFLPYCFDCFGKPVARCPNCGAFIRNTPM